ncbi:MAG: nucleoside 2-deoxyribosyltransferase [Nitrospirae bacterium]|nr:nucleoside 2-deoxyribosyltransferase [Nitrospirota bacterium]
MQVKEQEYENNILGWPPILQRGENVDQLNKTPYKKTCCRKGLDIKIINPQELISDKEIRHLGENANYEIFNCCKSHLDSVDILVAVLDGSQVDDGTAWEVGYFFRNKVQGQQIVGIRTDFRRAGESSDAVVNGMVECSCDVIVDSIEKMVKVMYGWLDSDTGRDG